MIELIPNWWPNREKSKFIGVDNYAWHIQKFGAGSTRLLLIHGTGASSHSWFPLTEDLELDFEILSLDLPGHGFTKALTKQKKQLKNIVDQIYNLLQEINFIPEIVLGHSAGAVIAYELAKKLENSPYTVAINAAFGQFSGLAGVAFPYFAKIAAATTIPARLLTLLANKQDLVQKLLSGTGSTIPREQIRCYQYLFTSPDHVDGTLQMMADWELGDFLDQLPRDTSPIHFFVGEKDKTVPSHISHSWARVISNSRLTECKGLGHLMHEEDPRTVSSILKTSFN